MNEIAVIAKNKSTYFIKRLTQEVGDVPVFDPWTESNVPEAHFYLVRTTGVYRDDGDLTFLEQLKRPVFNSALAMKLFRLKSEGNHFLTKKGFCSPVTLRLEDSKSSLDFVKHFGKVIVKPERGQGGWGIKILNPETFSEWWVEQEKKKDLDYILQEFLGDWEEYRVFFMGQVKQVTLKRTSPGAAANFAVGGKAVLAELPSMVPIHEIIEASQCVYGSIDIMCRKKQYSILEVNVSPGIEQLEMVSGQNIIKPLVSYLKSL